MDLTLYTSLGSGNAYKVELFLRLLRLPYSTRVVDLRENEHQSVAFLARNRFGQIPVLVDGDVVLTDSHAILLYLAGRYGEVTPTRGPLWSQWLWPGWCAGSPCRQTRYRTASPCPEPSNCSAGL